MADETLESFRRQWLTELSSDQNVVETDTPEQSSKTPPKDLLEQSSSLTIQLGSKDTEVAVKDSKQTLVSPFLNKCKTSSLDGFNREESSSICVSAKRSPPSTYQDSQRSSINQVKRSSFTTKLPLLTETKKIKNEEYEAFSIANKYLNVNTAAITCEQCSSCRGTLGGSNDSVHSRKRKRCSCSCNDNDNGNDPLRVNYGKSYPENESTSLVDLLIADIDEITSIPFFDLELPKEIAVKVFSLLSVRDLAACSSVNKQWKVISEDDLIWFNIYIRDVKSSNKRGSSDGFEVVDDRENWKWFVRDEVVAKRIVQQKWRERFCEVRDLEYEKGIKYISKSFHSSLEKFRLLCNYFV